MLFQSEYVIYVIVQNWEIESTKCRNQKYNRVMARLKCTAECQWQLECVTSFCFLL